jgi:hypothetical protein
MKPPFCHSKTTQKTLVGILIPPFPLNPFAIGSATPKYVTEGPTHTSIMSHKRCSLSHESRVARKGKTPTTDPSFRQLLSVYDASVKPDGCITVGMVLKLWLIGNRLASSD